ncbi:MAG: 2-isopropylmalate synthase [Deltaproteobacteria bacterium]|uniref:2-isopropylmalate synthase n=1 Tax=Candidatus Zymogenus saltonus TaxID=2844893 RepID=A0A9D8KDM1_9DELT|nr:2-isopropylmalate synthase [Candidatus Zymogenus saltonus]
MSDIVLIFDTTLRDGEQSPGASMNVREKVTVAMQLERLGVDIIEAGFPVASPGDFEAVREIAKTVKKSTVVALARAKIKDIDVAFDAIKDARTPMIHTFVSTSDIHLNYQLKKTRDEVIKIAKASVKRAKSLTELVEFSAMDATRSDLGYLAEVIKTAIEAGATTVNIPDTVGYTVPDEYATIIKYLMENVPGIEKTTVSVHCHNDLGLAVANSVAAVMCGARQVECTINGIGERAGNTSLEEFVMSLKVRKDRFKLDTNIKTELIFPTSRMVSAITGITVQPNKAIVGANAFSHESGIHQDGLLKEKLTYEIMTPQSIGYSHTRLVLGKHSGRHAFKERIRKLGYQLNDEQMEKAFKSFKKLADKKKDIFDEDIEAIVAEDILRIPERYQLQFLAISSGTDTIPTATVTLSIDGNIKREADFGDGPVDAVYRTIKKMVGAKCKLLSYEVKAITGGTDALGEVTVRLEDGEFRSGGAGAHTDIIVASAMAFINALNKLEGRKKKEVRESQTV